MRHYRDWENHIKTTKSKNTAKVYFSDILGIDHYLAKKGVTGLLDNFLTPDDISCYFSNLEKEKSASTYNRKISSIQGFLEFYGRGDLMPPMDRKITKINSPMNQNAETTQNAIFNNLQAPPITNERQASLWSRDKLLLLMLWLTDIQVEDLLKLKTQDIMEGNKALSINGDVILLPLVIQISLADWLGYRAKTAPMTLDQLFISPMTNNAMTKVGLHLRLNKHAKRLKLPTNRIKNRVATATVYR